MTVAPAKEVELRCPVGPRRLLAILLQRGERPKYVDGNLIEFACSDCARIARKENGMYDGIRGRDVGRVYHRYNLIGELIETEYERLIDS